MSTPSYPFVSFHGRRFLITPVCLVPNGRAHLGHIAGPLLKADILRRHIERAGGTARIISLSDAHESHVAVQAHKEGRAPEDIANGYHGLIENDLRALDIHYDELLNPLADENREMYEQINRDFLSGIVDSGNTFLREVETTHLVAEVDEPHHLSLRPRTGQPVLSGWLRGQCPHCGHPLVGFFCEACGGCFEPGQMVGPETAHFEGDLGLVGRSSLYLSLPLPEEEFVTRLAGASVREDFLEIVRRYFRTNGTAVRLTVWNPWGIPFDYEGLPDDEVIWSYSALLIGCHLVAGERHGQLEGTNVNAFSKHSGVETVVTFGIDNTIPYLVGGFGSLLAQTSYKPVDHFIANYFYDLDGSKFSTSRRHVIWGGDITTLAGADSDLTRAFLCRHNPEYERANFDPREFISYYNRLGDNLKHTVSMAARELAKVGLSECGAAEIRMIESAIVSQSASLDPGTFSMSGAIEAIESWLSKSAAMTASAAGAAGWLLGLALLAYPVMPRISQTLWTGLGFDGEPRITVLNGNPRVTHALDVGALLPDHPLEASELNRALPAVIQV